MRSNHILMPDAHVDDQNTSFTGQVQQITLLQQVWFRNNSLDTWKLFPLSSVN
jgi:hypothetical protein